MTIETPNIKGRRLRVLIAGCTALIAVPSLAISQADDELIVLEPITVQAQDNTQTLVASEATSGSGLATDVMDTSAKVSVVAAREIQQQRSQI